MLVDILYAAGLLIAGIAIGMIICTFMNKR